MVGCVASIVMGASTPVFAIIFGDFINVFAKYAGLPNEEDLIQADANWFSLMFVITGTVTGLAMFLIVSALLFGRFSEFV